MDRPSGKPEPIAVPLEVIVARFNPPLKIVIAGHTGRWASIMGEYKLVAELFNDHPVWQMDGTEHFIHKRNINTLAKIRHNWTCSWTAKQRAEQGGFIFSDATGALPVSSGGSIKYGWWKSDTKESIWDANITWSAVHEGLPSAREFTRPAQGEEPNQRTLEEQGFGLRRVQESEMEKLAVLLQCWHPGELGKGRDAKTYPRAYSELRLFAAWHLDVPDRADIYQAQRRIVAREMARASIQQQVSTKFDDVSIGDLEAGVNEKWLLHGTEPQLVMPIILQGLNERLSSLGGMFGAGVYLAEDAEKTDQYTRPDDGCTPDFAELHAQLFHPGFMHPGEDLFYVFVVRAVLGVPCYTADGKVEKSTKTDLYSDEHRRELGYILGKEPLRYHSLIAETGVKLKRYREFVVYNAAQTNICYLLAYRRV